MFLNSNTRASGKICVAVSQQACHDEVASDIVKRVRTETHIWHKPHFSPQMRKPQPFCGSVCTTVLSYAVWRPSATPHQ